MPLTIDEINLFLRKRAVKSPEIDPGSCFCTVECFYRAISKIVHAKTIVLILSVRGSLYVDVVMYTKDLYVYL